jgi:hypothetical protein
MLPDGARVGWWSRAGLTVPLSATTMPPASYKCGEAMRRYDLPNNSSAGRKVHQSNLASSGLALINALTYRLERSRSGLLDFQRIRSPCLAQFNAARGVHIEQADPWRLPSVSSQ